MASGVTECTWGIDATQQVFDNLRWGNAFTDYIIIASVMASNIVEGLKFYKPSITFETNSLRKPYCGSINCPFMLLLLVI